MKTRCDCCEGTEAATPIKTANRPGLSALVYRVGTHASFLETMKARLSNLALEIPRFDQQGQPATDTLYPLRDLKTRDTSDPAIALLDSWAMVADVLTFYQERIANEGYLRTATERRSILELARLIGYKLRPGVAASVYLAYTLDDKSEPVEIPAGARSQSIPGPGELPQSFETSEPLAARKEWNNLRPRLTQPQTGQSIQRNNQLWFKGISTNLKPNDLLLLEIEGNRVLRYVREVKPDGATDRTLVTLQTNVQTAASTQGTPRITTEALFKQLEGRPTPRLTGSLQLQRSLGKSFSAASDNGLQLLKEFHPEWNDTLIPALANANFTPASNIRVHAFRVVAPLFGNNAPQRLNVPTQGGAITIAGEPSIERDPPQSEFKQTIFLDAAYDKVLPGSFVVMDFSGIDNESLTKSFEPVSTSTFITTASKVRAGLGRAVYGITGKTTQIDLAQPWVKIAPDKRIDEATGEATGEGTGEAIDKDKEFQVIRRTLVYTQSEELPLAEETIESNICGTDEFIELDGLYEGLSSGRHVIISGERVIEGTSGVRATELLLLTDVLHRAQQRLETKQATLVEGEVKTLTDLPGDKKHTFIKTAEKSSFCYKRDTVVIYGNVVKATHGETRNEVLGGGDASQPMQQFTLKQPPLTYVSAPTVEGIASTLHVYVNDVEWHETETLAGLTPADRKFITLTDDEAKTTVVFGNGREGARLPTAPENVKAVYRNGIGKAGNVKAEQISLLTTRPLGVKEVINPLRASGGADRESRDQARRNAPLAVMSLDRLISTQDYADFARTFAGIGQTSAVRLSDGHRRLVHLTIAGADDIPIDERSDLFLNLRQALGQFGDPFQSIQVDVRELLALVMSVNVRVLPDYQWEKVEPKIRAALLSRFSFDERALGQPVFLSEVISTAQRVAGVAYVDVDVLDSVSESEVVNPDLLGDKFNPAAEVTAAASSTVPTNTIPKSPVEQPRKFIPVELAETAATARARGRVALPDGKAILPAQLAILLPAVPDTLILNLVKEVQQ
jgi:hypothetical protein